MNAAITNNQWPAELDALIAAPQHHTLLFENEFVRVLDTNIKPGEQTNIHTHQHPAALYILSWSDFIRYDMDGNVLVDSKALGLNFSSGTSIWTKALTPHSLRNIGDNDLHVISVEIKTTT
jgi:quercetin dioxygenase-like cupin family protein